jgi:hypothetical protein
VSRAAIVIAMLLATATAARAEPRYRSEARVAYLRALLGALGDSDGATLRQASDYARAMARGACGSGVARLKVECLMTAARRFCAARADESRCRLALDVIVSNALAEEQLIPLERRYQIMRASKDYRRALALELLRVQGALAVDFRLRMGGDGDGDDDERLARDIDRYCVASSDETNLAWQTCASSLVWFLRGARAAEAHAQ